MTVTDYGERGYKLMDFLKLRKSEGGDNFRRSKTILKIVKRH